MLTLPLCKVCRGAIEVAHMPPCRRTAVDPIQEAKDSIMRMGLDDRREELENLQEWCSEMLSEIEEDDHITDLDDSLRRF